MPEDAGVVDPAAPVFGLSASQIGRRIDAAQRPRGWAKASPATAAAWAWPRTWPPRGWSCRN